MQATDTQLAAYLGQPPQRVDLLIAMTSSRSIRQALLNASVQSPKCSDDSRRRWRDRRALEGHRTDSVQSLLYKRGPPLQIDPLRVARCPAPKQEEDVATADLLAETLGPFLARAQTHHVEEHSQRRQHFLHPLNPANDLIPILGRIGGERRFIALDMRRLVSAGANSPAQF